MPEATAWRALGSGLVGAEPVCYHAAMESTRRPETILPVLAAAGAAVLVAAVGGTMTDLGPWYRSLIKPSWQPPDWLFAPAWTAIFALAALSGVIAWRAAPGRVARETMVGLFAINGVLNIVWTALFFRVQRLDWALFEVSLLWASILVLILVLRRYSTRAAWLLVPYLVWVSFAAALNAAVLALN